MANNDEVDESAARTERYDARGYENRRLDGCRRGYYACQRVGLTNVKSIRGDLGTTLHLAKRKKRSDRATEMLVSGGTIPRGNERIGARKGTSEANGVITEECVRATWYDRELKLGPSNDRLDVPR